MHCCAVAYALVYLFIYMHRYFYDELFIGQHGGRGQFGEQGAQGLRGDPGEGGINSKGTKGDRGRDGEKFCFFFYFSKILISCIFFKGNDGSTGNPGFDG